MVTSKAQHLKFAAQFVGGLDLAMRRKYRHQKAKVIPRTS